MSTQSASGVSLTTYSYENFQGLDTSRDITSLDTGEEQHLVKLENGYCDWRGQIVRDPTVAHRIGSHKVVHVNFYGSNKTVYVEEDGAGINFKTDDEHSTDIKLDDIYTLKMKYPSLDEFIKSNFNFESNMNVDDTFDLIASCIDQVYSDEESWSHQECTKKELTEFVDRLNSSQFKEVEKFFETMPKLSHTVKVTNPNTKVESEIVLEGLQNFFA